LYRTRLQLFFTQKTYKIMVRVRYPLQGTIVVMLRLSALVVVQIPLKGMLLPRHPEFAVQYQFSRTRHPLYFIPYTNQLLWVPLVFLSHGPLPLPCTLSLLPFSLFAGVGARRPAGKREGRRPPPSPKRSGAPTGGPRNGGGGNARRSFLLELPVCLLPPFPREVELGGEACRPASSAIQRRRGRAVESGADPAR
jgi:hypothetical protein